MHTRNIIVFSFLLAAAISGLFYIVPGIGDYGPLRIVYAPAILITIAVSHGIHDISAAAGWTSFVVTTVVYWIIILMCYAVLWEVYLVHQGAREFEGVRPHLGADALLGEDYLETIGRALAKIESRRRSNWLLQNFDQFDLSANPRILGARALLAAKELRAVRGLLKKLEARLEKKLGHEKAQRAMEQLKHEAEEVARAQNVHG
jgi:hypothetical protein